MGWSQLGRPSSQRLLEPTWGSLAVREPLPQRILGGNVNSKQCVVSSGPGAWLKLRRENLLAHLGLLVRPPTSSPGSSQGWCPHIPAIPEVENTTWETSAPLHGSRMAWCASLLPPRASPLPSLFPLDFCKHKMWCQDSQTQSQRYLGGFDVWFICYREGLPAWGACPWREGRRNRKQRGGWRCEGSPGNGGQARLAPWRCDHLLGPRAQGELWKLSFAPPLHWNRLSPRPCLPPAPYFIQSLLPGLSKS